MTTSDFSGIRNSSELPSPCAMTIRDDMVKFLDEFVSATKSQLSDLEQAVLDSGTGQSEDENATATARRILHSIKGDAGILGLENINQLCHEAEFAVEELVGTARADMLLRVKDWLVDAMIHLADPSAAQQQPQHASQPSAPAAACPQAPSRDSDRTQPEAVTEQQQWEQNMKLEQQTESAQATQQGQKLMRCLIVEDDFTSRKLVQAHMAQYAECDIAVNGLEATQVVRDALERNEPYDLLCLDINMPEMDGQEALKIIRETEAEFGIKGLDCAKVIMTTALDDKKSIMDAFRTGCEAYLTKPVRKAALVEQLNELNLID